MTTKSMTTTANCAHHWLLESTTPGKPTVAGKCKLCGEVRQYEAYEYIEEEGIGWKRKSGMSGLFTAARNTVKVIGKGGMGY